MIDYKIFCIAGTRPEFIKLFPVYQSLLQRAQEKKEKNGQNIVIKWVLTGQHQELLEDLFDFFGVKPDYCFDLKSVFVAKDSVEFAKQEYPLADLAARILLETSRLLADEKPDLIIVQGDTMSTLQASLAAFYQEIPVAHVEAGIRTNTVTSPYPEELSRRIVTQLASLCFAPTNTALLTLEAEKVLFKRKDSFNFNTGNPGIDILIQTNTLINQENFNWAPYRHAQVMGSAKEDAGNFDLLAYLKDRNPNKKIILVTAHRREGFREAHANLVRTIHRIAKERPEVEFIISTHKNPDAYKSFLNLQTLAQQDGLNNIKCFEAINYPLFIKLMQASYMIVTDSGGIQEEAPYMAKPVLVCREETERKEGTAFGVAKLIHTDEEKIYAGINKLLNNPEEYQSMIRSTFNLYGDGMAAPRIGDISMLYIERDKISEITNGR